MVDDREQEQAVLTGRVAWVTGATGGVGPEVVRNLAGAGASIVATARDEAELVALQQQASVTAGRWLAVAADLTDSAVAAHVVATGVTQFGAVDILVALAGGWRGGATVVDADPADLDFLLRVNLLTAFNACRAVLPSMISRGWGRIITFGARAAVGGQAKSAAYAASKAALITFTQSIAAETRQSGITANALLLSTVDTPANRASMPSGDTSRWVSPEQIAATVRFLCTEEAGAITGGAIPVYGRA
jgi:NAD(P)-dependent dehydrogenase (short-subunit alcohol dehydrogenase family)